MPVALENKPYCCRLMQPDDAGQIRALFRQVFQQEMSQEFWDWKYGNALGKATVVFQGDTMVAHYGGMGRKVLFKGVETLAVQITDVMVVSSHRHSVRSGSPFYLAFTGFAREYLGYGKLFPLAYGFPNLRVMKLAQLLKFYAPVGGMTEITWLASSSLGAALMKTQVLDSKNFSSFSDRLDAAWESMKPGLREKIVAVKNADYIRQRYLEHPVKSYEVCLCQSRFGAKAFGVLVFRHDSGKSFLMDVIADVKHIPALLRLAAHRVKRHGNTQFYTWCSSGSASLFETFNGTAVALPITIPANIWTPGPDPQELQDSWWLLPGDTDFQ